MSLFENIQIPQANPKILKQLKGETFRDYQMFLDYCTHRNFDKLSKKYNLQVRQLFNVKENNHWKQRMQNLEQQCSNAFLAENFSKLYRHNIQKRENLLNLSINLQDRLSKFMEDVANAPISNEEDHQPTQMELIKIFRQQTRALIEIEKLAQIVDDQLKKFQIDTTPDSLSIFERDVILSEEMLNYFDDYNSVAELVEAPENPTNTMSSAGGGGCVADGGGLPEPKQKVTPKIPTENPDTNKFLPIKGDVSLLTEGVKTPELNSNQLSQEEIDLEKEIELGLKEIQENLKQINANFKTMPNYTQPILTNHKKQANNKLVKKIKSLAK